VVAHRCPAVGNNIFVCLLFSVVKESVIDLYSEWYS
jgi:hypothetical protein